MNTTVSIIVPCYKLGKYLPEALDSVLAQDYPDWECIIVNDGSPDDTQAVAESYVKKDARFKLLNQSNQGVIRARNEGVRASEGKYILFLDADDILYPDYLGKAVAEMEKNPDAALVTGPAEAFGYKAGKMETPPFSMEMMLGRNSIHISSLTTRKEFDRVGGFNPDMAEGLEDWDFWLGILEEGGKPVFLDTPVLKYRQRKDSRNKQIPNDTLRRLRRNIWEHHRELYAKYYPDPMETIEYKRLENTGILHFIKKKLFVVGLLAMVMISCTNAKPESVRTADALAKRLIPAQAGSIIFREVPADTADTFTLSSESNKIVIAANNAGTMAVGLNYYLNNYCNTTVSEYAAHEVEMPSVLPTVPEPVTVSAKVPYRFYLNYCTFGYTMPWWGWKEWERFIDWMALNGVNMPLATTGEEAVWQRVWRRFGMTDDQIRAHFTGPAHLAWHRMVNINSFQGPLPQDWIDGQAELQKKILQRERSLSMKPVLRAFSGSVPAVFKDMHPEATITKVSNWGRFGDPYRCWFLSPMDPLYTEIQKAYIEEQTAMFGTDHIYGLDPFNEVDAPSWDPATLAEYGGSFWKSLEAADPEAVWLQMGWFLINDRRHWTPENMEAYLGSVPRGKMIMLDYHDDWVLGWKLTDRFYGHDYIACALLNFGGNTLFNGNFPTLIPFYKETLEDGGANMKGVGSTLEGFGTNPYYYEFVLSQAWNYPQTPEEWIDKLADRHIGREDVSARALWHELIMEVAPQYTGSGVSMNAHPKFGERWNWTVKYPDIKGRTPIMDHAWRQMLEVRSDRYEWRYDLVNLGRQALGDYFDVLKDSLELAWNAKDLEQMKVISTKMGEVMDDCDRLVACVPEFNLQDWNEAARGWGKTAEEKDYYERSARTILSVWGNATNLTDYANRQWAGLIKSYYKPRWMMFCRDLINAVEDGLEFNVQRFDERIRYHEVLWTEPSATKIDYNAPGDPVELSKEIINKYGF